MKTHPQHPPPCYRRVEITHPCPVLKVSKVSLCLAARASRRFPLTVTAMSQPAPGGTAGPALPRSAPLCRAGPGRGSRRARPGHSRSFGVRWPSTGSAGSAGSQCRPAFPERQQPPAAGACAWGHGRSQSSAAAPAGRALPPGTQRRGPSPGTISLLLRCPCPRPLSLAFHCRI